MTPERLSEEQIDEYLARLSGHVDAKLIIRQLRTDLAAAQAANAALLRVAKVCEECKGSGEYIQFSFLVRCPICGGKGALPLCEIADCYMMDRARATFRTVGEEKS